MKRGVFIVFLCFLINFQIKGQCNALFSDTTSSSPCGVVQFTNLSTGTNSFTSYTWTLQGSTTPTSSVPNPTATYTANGTYTVCLSIVNFSPFCSSNICQTISINCFSAACAANFTFSSCDTISSSAAQMSFSNTSLGTNAFTTYTWNFGNSTTSNAQNPTATYTANGTYTVCLSFNSFSPTCNGSICQTVNINCIPPPPPTPTCQANFTNTPCSNGQMTFFSTSTGTNGSTAYTWSYSPPPTGPPAPYTATVCLIIAHSSPSCSSSVCKTVLVDCVVGVPEFIFENTNIRIFPNPSNGLFNLDISRVNLNSSFYIKVYNILGELVHQSIEEVQHDGANKEIDLQSLPNGAYYLQLSGGNKAYSVKLIITK